MFSIAPCIASLLWLFRSSLATLSPAANSLARKMSMNSEGLSSSIGPPQLKNVARTFRANGIRWSGHKIDTRKCFALKLVAGGT